MCGNCYSRAYYIPFLPSLHCVNMRIRVWMVWIEVGIKDDLLVLLWKGGDYLSGYPQVVVTFV